MLQKFEIFPKRYGFYPYIWMIYLAMPIYYLWVARGHELYIGLSAFLVFILTYRQLYMTAGTVLFSYWMTLQMLTVFILTVVIDLNMFFLGFFTANFIGWYTDKRMFRLFLLVFAIVQTIPIAIHFSSLTASQLMFFTPFYLIMLASPYGIRSMMQQRHLEEQLDEAQQHIKELIKREERMRIARDLHDTMGHTLSLITLKSELVTKLIIKNPERAVQEAREIERTSRAALREVRQLVSDMRAISIPEAVADAIEMLKSADITLQVTQEQDSYDDVPDLTQNMASLCLIEAVTNIVKHSQATRSTLSIERTQEGIKLRIRDNGQGIDSSKPHGNGLKGMSERLNLIDGSLQISSDSAGTELSFFFPLIVSDSQGGVSS
ncbi:sensor histidine kinase [Paenibacillus tundrae]|uniref:histidine kinase n=1 Tax=Paenibacillus tundrae TaxID=528187 RepID=A0ABT9WKP1_9BACL|nr:sensor histidine kinase [Paenibacillus tundrae]MDQ0173816.1 two-component system sensor histidine kinase DesK [Paenibacillus tundrae]